MLFRIKFVLCYINKKSHFFNIINLKNENNNIILKKKFKFLIDTRPFALIIIIKN